MDGKSLRENIRARILAKLGFLWDEGQGDETSPGGWWRMRNPIRYPG